MTCCKSGKAIVKFSLFKREKFKYKKANTKTWSTIEATEPLTSLCFPGDADGYHLVGQATLRNNLTNETSVFLFDTTGGKPIPGEFDQSKVFPYVGYSFGGFIGALTLTLNYPDGPLSFIYSYSNSPPYFTNNSNQEIINLNLSAIPVKINGAASFFNFTVKGAETGAEYLTLTNLDQCPEVQQEGCQLQPEQKFEIELIQFDASYLKKIPGFSSLPIPTVLTECVIVESAVPLAGPECVVIKKRLGVPYNIFEAIQGVIGLPFESVARVLCSDPGCPPPQVTVVCGDDDKSKECPPQTDCEITCKGFKCCYSKGKVIKVIPV